MAEVQQLARLAERARDALIAASASYASVEIDQPSLGTLVARHPVQATQTAAQAVLDAFSKTTRSLRSLGAIYQDVTDAGMTATEHQTALRAVLAYICRLDPDAFKKLGNLIPKLANILGDAADS